MDHHSPDFYESQYKRMFYDGGVSGWATGWIHRLLENGLKDYNFPRTLEIGGGEGFHVSYVKHKFTRYHLTDLNVRSLTPFANSMRSDGALIQSQENAESLTFQDSSFDRVLFMCVLHHLENPERALEEARRVTRPGGLVSIYLPCDPGLLYRTARNLLTWKVARKLRLDYGLINAREHKNHFFGLRKMISHVFRHDNLSVKPFPFPGLGGDLNIAFVFNIEIAE